MYDPKSSFNDRILYLKYYETYATTDNKRNVNLDKLFNDIKLQREHDTMGAPEYCDLMEKIIDAILYTRNIWDGRGERTLTYSYIYTLQHHLPIKAIFVLYMIVGKGLGSWRDVRGYVEYMGDPSCPFVKPILGLYNNQLEKDMIAYNAGLNDSDNKQAHWSKISLAAKWVPREKKERKYMFDVLVQMWCYRNPEYKSIMDTATSQYTKDLAFNKCKKMYRTMVSNLNRVLWKSEPLVVENNGPLSDSQEPKVPLSDSQEPKVPLEAQNPVKEHRLKPKVVQTTPLWRIVKWAAQTKNPELMNEQWIQRLKPLSKDYYVPMLDVSEPMYEYGGKPLYKAIIKACQYAYASNFGPNIIVFSDKPEWVSIADCTLEQIVQRLQSVLYVPYTGLKEAFELVQEAAKSAQMDERDLSLLKVKVITCQPELEYESCPFIYEKVYL
jgi:hypothetical protein